MAAKPIERFVKRQIADQGGWPRILERIASGETVADISRTLLRQPGGPCITRNFLSMLLHQDPERSALVAHAREEGAAAMVDHSLHLVDSAPIDRDSINKAKVQAEMRLKVAGFIDRSSWGEAKQSVNVHLQVGSLHVDALRHRLIPSSTADTTYAFQVPTALRQINTGERGTTGKGAVIDAEVIDPRTRETEVTAVTPVEEA